MARMRTFIAIELDKAIRERLIVLQEKLARGGADVKWVEPENLHVTLLFLGEVDDRDLIKVCRAVASACQETAAFELAVEAVGCFPNLRRPRVVWAGIGDGGPETCQLHDAIEAPLLELGCYRREARPFTPHITLGRVTSAEPTQLLTMALAKEAKWRGGAMPVQAIHVMSSELKSAGPTYTVLSRAKLGQGDA